MLDHISIGVRDVAKAKAFYDAALKPLGLTCLSADETSLGYGKEAARLLAQCGRAPGYPTIPSPGSTSASPRRAARASRRSTRRRWRMADATMGNRACARIMDRHYYAAFVHDPEGYRLEAYYGGK